MEIVISDISTWHIIITCIVLFIIFVPFAIVSTKKLEHIREEFRERLTNDGFAKITNSYIVNKIKVLPNFGETVDKNILDVYELSEGSYKFYYFTHFETDNNEYSRILKCVLIECQMNIVLPRMTIQPRKLKNLFTSRLDIWKAPKITFENAMNRFF